MLPLKLLEEAWKHRALIAFTALVGLMAVAKRQQETIGGLRAELAMKPHVEAQARARTAVKRVQAPVKVTTRVTTLPSGESVKERILERGTVVTETDTESKTDTKETPQSREVAYNRIVGVGTSPMDPQKAVSVKAGYSLGRIDLLAAYHFYGPAELRPRLEIAFRF